MVGGGGRGDRPRRVLFFLRAANFDRLFEHVFEEILRRGHILHVSFDKEKHADIVHVYRDLEARYPDRFAFSQLKQRGDRFASLARRLRCSIDYLRYLEPEYQEAHALRTRVRERTPRLVRLLVALPGFRGPLGRARLNRALRALDVHVPTPRRVYRLIERFEPDVVLVTPLIEVGSLQGDYIRVARQLGVPTVVPVASWDNLTNKGLIRDYPDRVVVWNEAQVDEAVTLHGIPRERVAAVGAHTYDHWFEWKPRTTIEDFAVKVGLQGGMPFLLYVCSSGFIAPNEIGFVEEWIKALRGSDDPMLREIGVVIRPHPQNVAQWESWESPEPGRVVLYPRGGAAPTAVDTKADYFDSLFHCTAVVGINTSALIEAAILRKPAFTIRTEEFRGTQEQTLHFAYLTGVNGVLSIAETWDEHRAHVADAARHPEREAERVERFLRYFIRPRGLAAPAAPLAVDVIEETARLELQPEPAARGPLRVLVHVLAAPAGLFHVTEPAWRRLILFGGTLLREPRRAPALASRFFRRRVLGPIRPVFVVAVRAAIFPLRRLPFSVRRRIGLAVWRAISVLPGPLRGRVRRLVHDAQGASVRPVGTEGVGPRVVH